LWSDGDTFIIRKFLLLWSDGDTFLIRVILVVEWLWHIYD